MGIGYLVGAFDLVSVGDVDVVAQARSRCSRLVVQVYTDEQVRQLQGRLPVVPLGERLRLVSHLRGVDAAVVHDEASGLAELDDFVFALVDGAGMATPEVLSPRRVTGSPELIAALSPVTQEVA